MKAVLISINPKHVVNILKGYKTLEIRKNCPGIYKKLKKYEALKEPLEVYIYCTKGPGHCYYAFNAFKPSDKRAVIPMHLCNGKVVAKFTLNCVEQIKYHFGYYDMGEWTESYILDKACLSGRELDDYFKASQEYNEKKPSRVYGYAWRIDNLEIFDEPKELSEFYGAFTQKRYEHIFGNNAIEVDKKYGGLRQPTKSGYEYKYPLTRAPESWCYIEV